MSRTEKKAVSAILHYVTKEWPWAEAPPEKVMEALRVLDKAVKK